VITVDALVINPLLAPEAGTAAGISVVIVQLVKDGFIAPRFPEGSRRDAYLRGISYLVNLGLLLFFVVTTNIYRPEDWLLYIPLAFGQALGTHFIYSTASPADGSGSK
jgi:hypothetical protein